MTGWTPANTASRRYSLRHLLLFPWIRCCDAASRWICGSILRLTIVRMANGGILRSPSISAMLPVQLLAYLSPRGCGEHRAPVVVHRRQRLPRVPRSPRRAPGPGPGPGLSRGPLASLPASSAFEAAAAAAPNDKC